MARPPSLNDATPTQSQPPSLGRDMPGGSPLLAQPHPLNELEYTRAYLEAELERLEQDAHLFTAAEVNNYRAKIEAKITEADEATAAWHTEQEEKERRQQSQIDADNRMAWRGAYGETPEVAVLHEKEPR